MLREAGLEVGPGRIADALTGLDRVGLEGRDDVYWTLRTTLVSRHDDLDAFDRAFNAWFLRAPVRPQQREGDELQLARQGVSEKRAAEGSDAAEGEEESAGWSADVNTIRPSRLMKS